MPKTTTSVPVIPDLPEIDAGELRAARMFLTSEREEERRSRTPHAGGSPHGPTIRNGITRARTRSIGKPSA